MTQMDSLPSSTTASRLSLLIVACMDFTGLNPATIIIAGTVLFACTGLIYTNIRANHGLKNPPGPRGLPVIGNVLQVPGQASKFSTFFFLS